jgi:glycosyltransferase involved in cell wall biosynthesis
MKRILMINDQFNYLSSGGHWRTINLASGLSELGYDVWLATPNIKFNLHYLRKIKFSNLIPKYNNNYINHLVNAILPIKFALEPQCYEFVYIQLPMPITKGFCEFIFKIKSIPVVVDFGDMWGYKTPESIFAKLHEAIATIIVKNASLITACSYELAHYLKLLSGKNVYVLNNSVDCFNMFNPDLYYTIKRINLGLEENKLVIVYSGSVSKSKNVHLIVNVAKVIPKEILNEIVFMIIGDGPYLNEMILEVKRAGLINNFIFTGFLPREKLPSYLKLSDLGIVSLSPIRGGLIKLAEYMAMGVVPIVPPNSWPSEHIRNGENGFITNVEELPELLNKIYNNRIMLHQLSNVARDYAIKNFDIRNVANKLLLYLKNSHN